MLFLGEHRFKYMPLICSLMHQLSSGVFSFQIQLTCYSFECSKRIVVFLCQISNFPIHICTNITENYWPCPQQLLSL